MPLLYVQPFNKSDKQSGRFPAHFICRLMNRRQGRCQQPAEQNIVKPYNLYVFRHPFPQPKRFLDYGGCHNIITGDYAVRVRILMNTCWANFSASIKENDVVFST